MNRQQFKEHILDNCPQFKNYSFEIIPMINVNGGQDAVLDGLAFSNNFIEGLYQGYLLRVCGQ